MITERHVKLRDPEKYEIRRYQLVVSENAFRVFGRGTMKGPYPIDFDTNRLEVRTLEKLVLMLRENRVRQAETELLGEYLYHLILDNEIGAELHKTLTQESEAFLRVELDFEDPKSRLANLPWEYLYYRDARSGNGYFLATRDRLALVRSPRVDNCRALRFKITATEKQLRVLIVGCSPADLPALDFDALLESVQALPELQLKTLITRHTDSPAFETSNHGLPQATHDRFITVLSDFEPHVVHFLGHGQCDSSGGKIAFVDDGYLADWRTGGKLANALRDHASVRLAFLQACESAVGDSAVAYRALSSVAGDLVQTGIPAIVAMQAKVENAAANSFAETFYKAIVEQRQPIYRAMQLARTQSGEAACIPVLYLGQDKDGDNAEGLLFSSAPPDQPDGRDRAVPPPLDFVCPWCENKSEGVQAVDKYCDACGSPIRCLNCGQGLPSRIKRGQDVIYCRSCQKKVNRYSEPPAPAEARPDRFDQDTPPTSPIFRPVEKTGHTEVFADRAQVGHA